MKIARQIVDDFFSLEPRYTALFLITCFLIFQPYPGIVHDARFYVVQALNYQSSGLFDGDLFFKYGSQDSFSLFSRLFFPVLNIFGLAIGYFISWLIAQMVFAYATWKIISYFFEEFRFRILSFLAAIALNHHYGWGTFGYGEAFVTPRIYAESASLFAIMLALRRENLYSILMLFLSVLLHPLTAISALLLCAMIIVQPVKYRLLIIAALVLVLVALALLNIKPFDRLFHVIDSEWYLIIKERSAYALVSEWGWRGVFNSLLPASVLIYASYFGDSNQKDFSRILLVLCLLALIASIIMADYFSNLLFMNLQLWRSLWLLSFFGNILSISLILNVSNKNQFGKFFIIVLVLNSLESLLQLPPIASSLCLIGSTVAAFERIYIVPKKFISIVSSLFFALATFAFLVFLLMKTSALDKSALLHLMVLSIYIVIFISIIFIINSLYTFRTAGLKLAIFFLFIFISSSSDVRTDEKHYLTSNDNLPEQLRREVTGKNVYWDGGVELLWFKLLKPSYFSCLQGAGVMFFRETAMEYSRRAQALSVLNTEDFVDHKGQLCPTRYAANKNKNSSNSIFEICTQLPELDTLVLRQEFQKYVVGSFALPYSKPNPSNTRNAALFSNVKNINPEIVKYYIYNCRHIRTQ